MRHGSSGKKQHSIPLDLTAFVFEIILQLHVCLTSDCFPRVHYTTVVNHLKFNSGAKIGIQHILSVSNITLATDLDKMNVECFGSTCHQRLRKLYV